MRITKHKKPLLNMLLIRWDMLSAYAATEKIYDGTQDEPELRTLLEQFFPHAIRPGSIAEMRMVKKKISEILPGADFVMTEYEAPHELDAEDYIQLYMSHQKISMDKVREIMEKRKLK